MPTPKNNISLEKTIKNILFTLFVLLSVILLLTLTTYFFNSVKDYMLKGASYLSRYIEEYYVFKILENEGFILSEKAKRESENNIYSFIIFKDLLNFKDHDPDEIRKYWKSFGMKDNEISIVIFVSKLSRNIPGMMDEIKKSTDELEKSIFSISKETRYSEESIDSIREKVNTFYQSIQNTLNRFTIVFYSIVNTFSIILIFYSVIYIFSQIRLTKNTILDMRYSFQKSIDSKEYNYIQLVPKSKDSNLLYIFQETLNKGISFSRTVNETLITLDEEFEKILVDLGSIVANAKGSLEESSSQLRFFENIDSSEIDKNINDIQNLLNFINKISKDIREICSRATLNVSEFINISNVFTNIVSEFSKKASSLKDLISEHIDQSKIFIDYINSTYSTFVGEIENLISKSSEIASKMRAVSINSVIEASKITSGSSGESIKVLSNKTIEISRKISFLNSEISRNLEKTKSEVFSSIKRIEGYSEAAKEIKNIFDETTSTLDRISESYSSISGVGENLQNFSSNLLSNVSDFIQASNMLNSNISKFIQIMENVKSMEYLSEHIKNAMSIFTSTIERLEITLQEVRNAKERIKNFV